jgi:DMSO/TMAO reductase YedYZ molybdopterin-dependent catalytic subunit
MTGPQDALAARALRRHVEDAVVETSERLRERGAVSRRGFLHLLGIGAVAPMLAACNAQGTPGMRRLLKAVGKQNERFERWLLAQSDAVDRVPAGLRTAGRAFPSYFVSPQMPRWDASTMGRWTLEVNGAVRRPLRLALPDLMRLATRAQRVQHYCVEGWNAAVEFQGVPLASLLRMAQPTRDAAYVDFASFDSGYHESWDMESVMHPQTLVVLGKDGAPLSAEYGAPARVHSPIKLGYKNTKYLTRITLMPSPNGGYWSDKGYEWFGGT